MSGMEGGGCKSVGTGFEKKEECWSSYTNPHRSIYAVSSLEMEWNCIVCLFFLFFSSRMIVCVSLCAFPICC